MNEQMDSRMTELGLNIAYYRKINGLTQIQLAQEVGISRTHVSNIEAPKRATHISVETLFKIADALNIEPWRLLVFHRDKKM